MKGHERAARELHGRAIGARLAQQIASLATDRLPTGRPQSATPRQRYSITMRSVCTLEIASGHRPHPKPNSYPARFSVTFPRSAV